MSLRFLARVSGRFLWLLWEKAGFGVKIRSLVWNLLTVGHLLDIQVELQGGQRSQIQ